MNEHDYPGDWRAAYAQARADALERDRYREALEQVVLNLDGENRDGNIFPMAALRAASDALSRNPKGTESP